MGWRGWGVHKAGGIVMSGEEGELLVGEMNEERALDLRRRRGVVPGHVTKGGMRSGTSTPLGRYTF